MSSANTGKLTRRYEQAYQNAASFVPKLATKVMQWLDPQADDVILDIGCGGPYNLEVHNHGHCASLAKPRAAGILDLHIAHVLAQGSGSLHGIDSSGAMINAARQRTTHDATLQTHAGSSSSKITFQGPSMVQPTSVKSSLLQPADFPRGGGV